MDRLLYITNIFDNIIRVIILLYLGILVLTKHIWFTQCHVFKLESKLFHTLGPLTLIHIDLIFVLQWISLKFPSCLVEWILLKFILKNDINLIGKAWVLALNNIINVLSSTKSYNFNVLTGKIIHLYELYNENLL